MVKINPYEELYKNLKLRPKLVPQLLQWMSLATLAGFEPMVKVLRD